jgi:hypothetical protein
MGCQQSLTFFSHHRVDQITQRAHKLADGVHNKEALPIIQRKGDPVPLAKRRCSFGPEAEGESEQDQAGDIQSQTGPQVAPPLPRHALCASTTHTPYR